MSTAVVILAAGKGTRMASELPKALHKVGHATLLEHAMRSVAKLAPERLVVVVGHMADMVAALAMKIDHTVLITKQDKQRGTAHAVAQAKRVLHDFEGDLLVLYAYTPFITSATMINMKRARDKADLVLLGFEPEEPGHYGRIIVEENNIKKIVEFNDATETDLQVPLCNSGVMAGPAKLIFSLIRNIKNKNAAGEYYLTDCVELAGAQGKFTTLVQCDEAETIGVNSRHDLAIAEATFQNKARQKHIAKGVTLLAPETVFFSLDTVVEPDCIIEQNVVFGPNTTIKRGAHIKPFSHVEGANVASGAIVGPFAHLRPGSEIGDGARVGNFVEIKNAVVGMEAKINHLSYIGDAQIGARVNIGAGSITCNFDGVMKHHTTICDDAFIGSNTMLVAPITIGENAMTASGSVVTKDVPRDALATARSTQENKAGLARKLINILKKRKQRKDLG